MYDMSKKRKNVHVGLKMNVEAFWKMVLDAIQLANVNSPVNKKQ